MTTLIIEQNKEPQDVPGVVIPPPGVSEPVIKNTPFFPDVDPKRVRDEMRLEQIVSPVRLRRAIKTAIAETNAELGEWRERQLDAGYATLARVLVVPGLMTLGGALLGFNGAALGVIFLFSCTPTAAGSYVMTRAMGGNATLAANIIALTTLGSFFTTALGLALLRGLHLV